MNKKTAGINVDAKKETGIVEDAKNINLLDALHRVSEDISKGNFESALYVTKLCIAKVESNQASESEPVIRLLKNTRIAPDGKHWNNLYIQVRNGSPISIDLVGKTRSNWKIRNLLLAHATEFTPTWAYKQPETAPASNGPSWEPPVEEEEEENTEAE